MSGVSWLGFFVALVGIVTIFIGKEDLPAEKEEPQTQEREAKYLRDELTGLKAQIALGLEQIRDGQTSASARADRLEKKIEFLEVKVGGQKPPVINLPDKLDVAIVSLPPIRGALSLSTPPGKRMRILHREAKMPKRKEFLGKAKSQIEALGK